MSAYELDDDLVRQCLHNGGSSLPQYLANALTLQLPLPTPMKIGAVVQTGGFPSAQTPEPTVFIRWATDGHTVSPWIEASDHERPYRTDEIGRIVEVLSEGVDL